ncbi:MAG: hypothetical protein HC883_02760 [Bdellovibrionaceae bacterium]|nr:hypothetical protein [Pseudobdellovibrionaceae bacterium]
MVIWKFTTEEITDPWDIYPYLLTVVGVIALIRAFKIPKALVAFTSFVTVSIPFWLFEGFWRIPAHIEAVLWGRCLAAGATADWPLLPWLAYPLLAYAVGGVVRDNREDFRQIKRPEVAIWLVLLAGSIPFLGGYYVTPLGEDFGCYVFRRPVLEFWAHQIWIWFFIRASLTVPVQAWLNRKAWARWISNRQINQRFFLVYFLHFPLAFLAGQLAHKVGLAYWIGSYFGLIFLRLCFCFEGLPVVIAGIFAKISRRGDIMDKKSAQGSELCEDGRLVQRLLPARFAGGSLFLAF